MRENASSLDFNFISLLNPAVDKNWVYRHHLLQFFLEQMMFRSIQTFSVTSKFTEHYHIFCARIDLLFTIFVCSRYRPWATIWLLHHFGFVMCVNSRLYCMHFSCHWRKIRMFCVGWCKSLVGSATPVYIHQTIQHQQQSAGKHAQILEQSHMQRWGRHRWVCTSANL